MGTGLIYAAIVAAWAAYLVPLWLRRHDEAAASRSVDRFSQAMRVLERRRPATAGVVSDSSAEDVDAEPVISAATRRRRTLVVLLALSTVLTVPVVLGLFSRWTLLAPGSVILVFLAASARAGRLERERARLAWQRLRERAAALAELEAAEAAAAAAAADPEPVYAILPEEDYPRHREDDSDRWVPRDVPLPTYLEKARAPRTVRTVDLSHPSTEDRPVDAPDVILDESGRTPSAAATPDASTPADPSQQRAVGD